MGDLLGRGAKFVAYLGETGGHMLAFGVGGVQIGRCVVERERRARQPAGDADQRRLVPVRQVGREANAAMPVGVSAQMHHHCRIRHARAPEY